MCKTKAPWDADIREPLRRRWNVWEKSLPKEVTVPRLIVNYREPVLSVELHRFGDASTKGVGVVVYSVVRRSGTTQQLVAAKSRRAKEGLTIPRLELISAHMATNLVKNVQNALENLPEPTIYGLLDNTVALYWIHGGQYRQFVANRVSKIKQHPEIVWRHGGVGLIMTHIRKRYWIPKLRSLAKRQIKSCYGCRRFQATAIVNPPLGMLPKDRT